MKSATRNVLIGLLLSGSSLSAWAKSAEIIAIGRLEAGRKQCSATLLSSHQIVTAAHCLFNSKTRKLYHPSYVNFYAGYQDGRYRLSSMARSYVIGVKSFPSGKFDEKFLYNDWAVVTLSTPIGCNIEPLEIDHKPATTQTMSTFGYGSNTPHQQVASHGCEYALPPRENTALRLKNCHVESGYSGAPLLRRERGQWHLVGLISAQAKDSQQRLRQMAVPSRAFAKHIKPRACRQL
ncbi:trypsin-like serine peptidase [Vibrio sp. WXL103]|uniref:trypsin-like serine peptidase n=1 Tax=Vibrio sp. WXL103 TaxID=3450710 RepID=UPI003EC7818B